MSKNISDPTNISSPGRIAVYRHELKFFINFFEYTHLSSLLQKTMKSDPYGKINNEYWIRSLYFDTMDNNDFYEKMMGLGTRKKLRLRLYHTNQPAVKIEIKNKYNHFMLKETATLPRRRAMRLIRGDKGVLLKESNQTLQRIYYFMCKDLYRPVVVVDYEREAYLCELQNIRITFDKNIRANVSDFNLFNPELPMFPVFQENILVMEIKYNRFMPDWIRNLLKNLNTERYAISKYCLARAII